MMAAEVVGKKTDFIICFAGQHYAKLLLCCCCCSSNSEVASAPWYLGRGRPANTCLLPSEVDVWIWGGISQLTERVMRAEAYLQDAALFFAWIIASVGMFNLWGDNHKVRWIVIESSLAAMAFLYTVGFLWRIRRMAAVVKGEIAPKLRLIGYKVECYQRPWFSYHRVTFIDEAESDNNKNCNHDEANELESRYQGLDDVYGGESIRFPVVLANLWDWQGYSYIFPANPAFFRHQHNAPDVWTWGGFVEIARGRIFENEKEDQPLIDFRRRRRLRSWGNACLYISFYYYFVPSINKDDEDSWFWWLVTIPSSIFMLFWIVFQCRAGVFDDLSIHGAVHDNVQETITNLLPVIKARANLSLILEASGPKNYGWVLVQQRGCHSTHANIGGVALPGVI